MQHTLVAMFDDRNAAMRARERLLAAGFDDGEVSVRDGASSAGTMGSNTTATTTSNTYDTADTGIGAWFRSLFGLDDDDDHVRLHEEATRRGATMLSVDTRDEASGERALEILQDCGAIDLDTRAAQWRSEGWGADTTRTASAGAAAATTRDTTRQTGDTTIPIVEEQLAVGKRVVQRGGVRLFTRIVERPVEEQVQLREEHAEIHRRKVDRPATEADLAAMKQGTIELRETAEEAVVSKRANVVEEVDVGKRVSERTETVRDSVRHTEVDVDKIGSSQTERDHAVADRGRLASDTDRDAGGRRRE